MNTLKYKITTVSDLIESLGYEADEFRKQSKEREKQYEKECDNSGKAEVL